MDIENQESVFEVSDLYLSAFFKAKGVKLLGQSREGKRVNFVFKDKGNKEKLIEEFYNGGLVDVTAFKSAIQDLKTIIFNRGDKDEYEKYNGYSC